MRAVDTNILVYAHRADSRFHRPAVDLLRELAEGKADWAIPWPCVYEFYSVVTHPRVYSPPSTPEQALAQLRAWIESPSLTLLGEPARYWDALEQLLRDADVTGPLVHDARIAAICVAHGVDPLITLDRDFSRFPELRTVSLIR